MSKEKHFHASHRFPEGPITIIVGYPPGGSLDLTAQPLVEALNVGQYLPRSFNVIHIPGDAGTKGMKELLSSQPDGYTLNLAAMGVLTLQPHIRDLPYKTAEDYTPILGLVNNPVCLAVRNDAPWENIESFISDAMSRPGAIKVGDLGKGSALHLATEQMKLTAKIDICPSHMTGSPENLKALLSGDVDAVTNHHAVFIDEVKAGRVRILGVFEEKRNDLFPDSQTFLEAGYDIIFDSYACLIGPKAIAEPILSILHDACKKAMADPLFTEPMKERGLDLFYQNPSDLKKILNRDYDLNASLVKAIGLTAG